MEPTATLTDLLSHLVPTADIEITIRITHPPPTVPPTTIDDSPKQDLHSPQQTPHDPAESMQLLDTFGVNGDKLTALAQQFSPPRIRQCIHGTLKQPNVKNRAAYLIKALSCGYYRALSPEIPDELFQ